MTAVVQELQTVMLKPNRINLMQMLKRAAVKFENRKKYLLIIICGISSLRNFSYVGFQQYRYFYAVIGYIICNNPGREYYEFR